MKKSKKRNELKKPNCSLPLPLADLSFYPFVCENDSIQLQALSLISLRQNSRKSGLGGKTVDFLIGLSAPPGGGKSFSLDTLAKLGQDKAELQALLKKFPSWIHDQPSITNDAPVELYKLNTDHMAKILENPVGITLKFTDEYLLTQEEINAVSTNATNAREILAELLGWRIICSYFSRMSLRDFITNFRSQGRITLGLAFEMVFSHATRDGKPLPHVILCVDEIMNSASTGYTCSILGDIVDKYPNVSVFLSTLNATSIDSMSGVIDHVSHHYSPGNTRSYDLQGRAVSKPSGRRLRWLHVPPIPFTEAVRLFTEKGFNPRENHYLYNAICMAGGHPRSLQIMLEKLSGTNFPKGTTSSEFMVNLESRFSNLFSPLTPELVNLAIRGTEVDLRKEITVSLDGPMRLGDFIQLGVFLNSIDPRTKNTFVPVISPFLLRFRFFHDFYDPRSSLSGSNRDMLMRYSSLKTIIDTPIPVPSDTSISHSAYLEKFHALWEDCKRVAFLGIREMEKKETPLVQQDEIKLCRDIYDLVSGDGSPEAGYLIGSDCSILLEPNLSGPIKSIFDYHPEELQKLLRTPEVFEHVLRPKNLINKGFDLAIVEQSTKKAPILILIECKSSMTKTPEDMERKKNKRSGTHFTQKQVHAKIASCVEQFEAVFKEKGEKGIPGLVDVSQVYVVFTCTQLIAKDLVTSVAKSLSSRKITTKDEGTSQAPNVVILPRDKLLKLYTPSLSYNPAFLTCTEIEKNDVLTAFNRPDEVKK